MSKYTKEINEVVKRFNNLNPKTPIGVSHRNGYTAIDFVKDNYCGNCFKSGMTDKECLSVLYVMCQAIENYIDNN